MAKINVKEIRSGVRLNTSKPLDMATISIANFVPVSNTEAFLLISQDTPNDLKLGSDNKLLSQPTDTDFLAYYILAKG